MQPKLRRDQDQAGTLWVQAPHACQRLPPHILNVEPLFLSKPIAMLDPRAPAPSPRSPRACPQGRLSRRRPPAARPSCARPPPPAPAPPPSPGRPGSLGTSPPRPAAAGTASRSRACGSSRTAQAASSRHGAVVSPLRRRGGAAGARSAGAGGPRAHFTHHRYRSAEGLNCHRVRPVK
jgi:hypothetical protein